MINKKKILSFRYFVNKEFLHIFRDMWTTLILLLLPILSTILFGFGISTEIKNAKVAIMDFSQDIATRQIANKISTSEYFDLKYYVHTEDELESLFKQSKIHMAIVFSERFYENMLHTGEAQVLLLTDASDPNTANTLSTYATMIITSYQTEINQNIYGIPYVIIPEIRLLYNPSLKGSYSTAPGVMGLVLMLICAMMTSVAIVREKQQGTMEILLVSPLKPMTIIMAKVIPYFCISLINLISTLLLSVYVLKVPIVGNLVLLIGLSLIYIATALSLGILVSTVVKTQLVAMLISGMVLMIPVVFLSGLIFPIESMPIALQWISHIVPTKWFILATKGVMIKGAGFRSIMKEFFILLAMAVLLIIISIKKFKNRL